MSGLLRKFPERAHRSQSLSSMFSPCIYSLASTFFSLLLHLDQNLLYICRLNSLRNLPTHKNLFGDLFIVFTRMSSNHHEPWLFSKRTDISTPDVILRALQPELRVQCWKMLWIFAYLCIRPQLKKRNARTTAKLCILVTDPEKTDLQDTQG